MAQNTQNTDSEKYALHIALAKNAFLDKDYISAEDHCTQCAHLAKKLQSAKYTKQNGARREHKLRKALEGIIE